MYRFSFLLLLSLLLFSCNDYQKLLNSPENEVDKYTAAEEYYNNGEFRRANALIEQIIPTYRGKPQGERSANRNNSEQKPRDGKPNNKRRNNSSWLKSMSQLTVLESILHFKMLNICLVLSHTK